MHFTMVWVIQPLLSFLALLLSVPYIPCSRMFLLRVQVFLRMCDSQSSLKMYSWLHSITVKGYRLDSLKEKGSQGKVQEKISSISKHLFAWSCMSMHLILPAVMCDVQGMADVACSPTPECLGIFLGDHSCRQATPM